MVKAAVAYADTADRWRSYEDRCITSPDSSITGLRAFVRYHKDARQDFMVNGRMRSLTHKQVALHGLTARLAVSGETATIRSMAKEASCAPSTVSRFLLKLQAWGEYAIDVTRGRHGGVRVRQRWKGDGLAEYARRAWERIKRASDRARINVASLFSGDEREQEPNETSTYLYMDATFTAVWDAEERRGRLLAEQTPTDAEIGAVGHHRSAAAQADWEWANAEEWARQVIVERQRLDREEPDWDLELDRARERWLK